VEELLCATDNHYLFFLNTEGSFPTASGVQPTSKGRATAAATAAVAFLDANGLPRPGSGW